MPPDNTNACKSNEILGIRLEEGRWFPGEEGRPQQQQQQNGIGHSRSQTNVKRLEDGPHRNRSVCSLMDELLCDIYGKEVNRRTSATTCDLSWQDSDCSRGSGNGLRGWHHWKSKDIAALRAEKIRLEKLIAEEGSNLVKHLKRKSVLLVRREAHCDVITAYIQAISTKTREDTKMKFSLSPGAETGFSQWVDAMKMVAQLPGGMPSEFRTKLWLQLSEKHLNDQKVDWERAEAVIFNEWTNPDDEELGVQIVKDLHRTGCSLFCGEQEHNQALLKRVLLAYARWNKNVGYCQGFNMLAALILQVMDKDERNAVKVMIYLIEGVLPESYFANNLRGLSVDMAVFRDLLRLRLPKLSKHLEALQHDTNSGTSYEPPLTNVFTMQWFLTLFSNCLPQQTVLRVWDLVFLYGNEVLLRTALAIWGILQDRVITVESADEFYSIMGVVTREMLEFGLMDANALVKMIAMVDPFPNELQELREKYLYNISPWTQSVQSAAKKGIRLFYSDQDDQDDTEDEDKIALATAYGVFRRRESTSKELRLSGPTLDISVLKQQYAKLRQRQRQAHVIITAACSSNLAGNLAGNLTAGPSVSVNHLLMGKSALINKGRRIGPPEGSIPPPKKGERSTSGETQWKDSGKSNRVMQENEKNRYKLEREKGRLKTNHDRTVTEKSVEDSLRRKANRSSSSSSSTSTELCDDEQVLSDTEEGSQGSPGAARGVEEGCEGEGMQEIREAARELVREIEERVQEKLGGTIDNTKPIDADIQIQCDNILKPEPEVPTCDNVIATREAPEREVEREEEGRGKMRRKSDLGLSVIRENLEMLSKFSQKCGGRSEGRSTETEKTEKSPEGERAEEEKVGKKELVLPIPEQTKVEQADSFGSFRDVQTEMPVRGRKNTLVEKAISPMVEKAPKTEKVNKEVNTELTFGVEEVEISTRQPKVRVEEQEKLELELPTTSSRKSREAIFREKDERKSREAIFREKDEMKRRIETSKSDWELKMRKIAELETTTREALNEIQAKSMHRKSVHRSLDRNTRRSYLEEGLRSPEKSFVPRIEVESSEGETDTRKWRISALSFDEITSRTEKLLGGSPEGWKQKSWGSRSTFGEEVEPRKYQRYEAFSSPTSPEYRSGGYVPLGCTYRPLPDEGAKEDLVRITENEGRTSLELLERRYSPERQKPEADSSRTSFNPFPRRSQSRPKELGVKLGLYPTSPEGQRKKS